MPPDMQAQSKDVLFFRKIQSSVGKSVRLFIGAQIIETFLNDRTSFIKQHVTEKQ